jgi:hypothetical protein
MAAPFFIHHKRLQIALQVVLIKFDIRHFYKALVYDNKKAPLKFLANYKYECWLFWHSV